jgi:hypothetical protein
LGKLLTEDMYNEIKGALLMDVEQQRKLKQYYDLFFDEVYSKVNKEYCEHAAHTIKDVLDILELKVMGINL